MYKLFPDKFDEIFAEENGTESAYGLQLMKDTIQTLVKRVEALEHEIATIKLHSNAEVPFWSGPYYGVGPVSGLIVSGQDHVSDDYEIDSNDLGTDFTTT